MMPRSLNSAQQTAVYSKNPRQRGDRTCAVVADSAREGTRAIERRIFACEEIENKGVESERDLNPAQGLDDREELKEE